MASSRCRNITASYLAKTKVRSADIDRAIKEQLAMIDEELMRAESVWGQNFKRIEMPQTFAIPGLAKVDAQRMIYSSILLEMQNRGFDVKMYIREDTAFLILGWVTKINEEDTTRMSDIIKDRLITEAEFNQIFNK